MVNGIFPIEQLLKQETPLYYYDMAVLRRTIDLLKVAVPNSCYRVHYAVRACASAEILDEIAHNGFGADCVSGGEVEEALRAGIPASKVAYSGIAKLDREIAGALRAGVSYFNVETRAELEAISHQATRLRRQARVCLRVQVGASDSRLGIPMQNLEGVIRECLSVPSVVFAGLYISVHPEPKGVTALQEMAARVQDIITRVEQIRYTDAELQTTSVSVSDIHIDMPIADYTEYAEHFLRRISLREGQVLHFVVERSLIADCCSLLTRVLYVRESNPRPLAVLDANMVDFTRSASHQVDNLTHPEGPETAYDLMGPRTGSLDDVAEDYAVAQLRAGDLLAVRGTGAYGEAMARSLNQRKQPGRLTSDDLGFMSLGL